MSLCWSDLEFCEPRKPEVSLPLFEQSHARKDDPQTSKDAARQASVVAASHCFMILEALKAHGPMGKTRLAAKTGIDHVAVCRRLADLKAANLALPTGDTEKSGTNRDERIWQAL